MFGEVFHYRATRKVIAAFGTLFNEVMFVRYDDKGNGQEISRGKVPIVYAPKKKYLVENLQDLNKDEQVGITYPRMSFAVTKLYRDESRQLNPTFTNSIRKDNNTYYNQLNPVPYNVEIELYVIANNTEDALQIVERIVPYFHPELTVTVNTGSELNIKEDLPFSLLEEPFEDTYEGNPSDRRSIVWTLRFVAKTNFYGRVTTQGIIRKIQIDFLIPGEGNFDSATLAVTPRVARVTTEPNPIDASPTDNYGFTHTINEYSDGMKYNPTSDEDEPV